MAEFSSAGFTLWTIDEGVDDARTSQLARSNTISSVQPSNSLWALGPVPGLAVEPNVVDLSRPCLRSDLTAARQTTCLPVMSRSPACEGLDA